MRLVQLITAAWVLAFLASHGALAFADCDGKPHAAAASSTVTLRLPPNDTLRAALRGLGAGSGISSGRVKLLIEGLKVRGAEPAAVRVFLNKPEANEKTTVGSAQYVTSVSLFPVGSQEDSHNFVVDLTPTLKRLVDAQLINSDQDLLVTFVAIPLRPRPGANRVEIHVDRVLLPGDLG